MWTEEELRRVGEAQELEIAPVRRNGELRTPTIIWAVRAGDALYARAAYGPTTGWHKVARRSGEGRVRAAGVERDVTIEDASPDVYDAVDAAYRAKYGHYSSIVDGITSDQARATTVRITPR
jgi:hypothetical protein